MSDQNALKAQREADKEALQTAENFERNAEEFEAMADGTFRGGPVPEALQLSLREMAKHGRRLARELRFCFDNQRPKGMVQ